jgi:hypothetical protein
LLAAGSFAERLPFVFACLLGKHQAPTSLTTTTIHDDVLFYDLVDLTSFIILYMLMLLHDLRHVISHPSPEAQQPILPFHLLSQPRALQQSKACTSLGCLCRIIHMVAQRA